MSKLIHVASATATIAAAVLLPLLVTLLLNDGSLLPLLVLLVMLPQLHSGSSAANRFARERHFRDDSRMVGDSATMNIIWVIHSTCLGIHLEEACGRMTTER